LLSNPPTPLAQERPALPESDRYAVLADIQAMRQGQYSRSGPSITVFEVGGGDPAMNGSFVYLRIDHFDRAFVWKTGLNVRGVKKMIFAPGNAILLRVQEDFMDGKGTIVTRDAEYTIRFKTGGGALQDKVTVESGAGALGKK
jgi:hypothetical protein